MKFGNPKKGKSGFYNVSGLDDGKGGGASSDDARVAPKEKPVRKRQLPIPKDNIEKVEDTGQRGANSPPIMSTPNDKADPYDRIVGKSNTWSTLKNKLKGSLKIKSLHKKRSSLPNSDATPERTNNPERYNLMGVLEDHARLTLSVDECKAVLRHVHTYHENKDLNRLMQLMFAILDKPEKQLLLIDIRGVIAPGHVAKFDDLVEDCNFEAYEMIFGPVNLAHRQVNQENITLKSDRAKRAVNGSMTDISGNFLQTSDLRQSTEPKAAPRSPRNGFLQAQTAVNSDSEDVHSSVILDDTETVYVSKHKIYLGLVVAGGKGPRREEPVRVVRILPGGAASDHKSLLPGREVTHIDGHSLAGLTSDDVETLMQNSFCNKNPIKMEIKLKRSTS